MTKKRVSIKDIAAAAGVSHPTVSRALRGTGRISDQTRARIQSIAQEMGYTPNLVARGLVTQRTRSIGLIVTDIGDPFHSEIIRGVEHVTRANEYSLILGSTTADPDQELRVVRSLHGRNVDGLIIASSQVGDRYADLLDELGIPIVLINSHAEGDNLHAVNHEDFRGASQMMDHLLAEGYRRIAFLGHRRAGRVHGDRRRAWQKKLEQAGMNADVTINAPEPTIEHGAASVDALLERAQTVWGERPDAIFCYNDRLAIGVISGLRQRGLRVPGDIAVAGFDDLDVSAHLDPALTTIHQPRQRMGIRATEALLNLLAEDETRQEPQTILLSGELMVRESTQRRKCEM